MKKILSVALLILATGLPASAGELFIARGLSNGFTSDKDRIVKEARDRALEQVPSGYIQRSQWQESAASSGGNNRLFAAAVASFIDPSQAGPWYFTAKETSLVTYDNTEIPVLVAKAKQRAQARATFYCASHTFVDSNWTENVQEIYGGYQVEVEARFACF
jgi:hypothetical protein